MFTRRGFMKTLAGAGLSLAFGKPALSAINTVTAHEESDVLFPIEVNGKHGYIDRCGNVVVRHEFDDCFIFSEGYGCVKKGNAWGFINSNGDMVIEPRFTRFSYFKEGLAKVNLFGSYAIEHNYINKNGNTVISLISMHSSSFSEGLASVKVYDFKYGCIDKKGVIVIEPVSDKEIVFSEGLAAASTNGSYGYIDKRGKFIIPTQYEEASGFSEGLASVKKWDNKMWFYIDKIGRDVFETAFDRAEPFCEGLAFISIGKKSWFIDRTGRTVIELKKYNFKRFIRFPHFSEGLCAVTVKLRSKKWHEKSGFIDMHGNIVIEPAFDRVSSFRNGLAWVDIDDNKRGYIDRTGKYIWGPRVIDNPYNTLLRGWCSNVF